MVLKKGDIAPGFCSRAFYEGEEVNICLKDFLGKKVILYFYPKDLTPGCTMQAENLRDNYLDLKALGFEVIGVSADPISKHRSFSEKKNLNFYLVSDENKEVIEKYGVWQLKKFMGREYYGIVRTTFIIGEDGRILEIINKPKVKAHSEEILDLLNLNK